MFLFRNWKAALWVGCICFLIPITAALLNKNTPLAWDPALVVSAGVWAGGSLLVWIIRKVKAWSNKKN